MDQVEFNAKRRRIRCIGHIINLSLQSFLLARSKEALSAALEATEDTQSVDPVEDFAMRLSDPTSRQEDITRRARKGKSSARASQQTVIEEEYAGWQGIQPLQKLHSLAVWLRNSAIHSDSWRKDVGLSLGIDNATRWSSWYKVLDNAMKKKNQITQFLFNHDKELADAMLTSSDWDLLSKTHRFLEPFASAILYAEGKCSSVSQSLILMDAVLLHYEDAKKEYRDDSRMLKAIEMGWFVLDKYYTMTEDVPVYAASLLLDPSRRLAYIDQNWPSDWHEKAISGARDIWKAEYQLSEVPSQPAPPTPPPKKDNQLARLYQRTEVKKKAINYSLDDLDAFIAAEPIEIEGTPLQWWCRLEQRSQYPRLSQMAIDTLSIPSESAEPERAFSGARRTASWDRLKMSCDNLEKVECIGSWLREGLIVPSSQGGLGLVCSPEPVEVGVLLDPALEIDRDTVDAEED